MLGNCAAAGELPMPALQQATGRVCLEGSMRMRPPAQHLGVALRRDHVHEEVRPRPVVALQAAQRGALCEPSIPADCATGDIKRAADQNYGQPGPPQYAGAGQRCRRRRRSTGHVRLAQPWRRNSGPLVGRPGPLEPCSWRSTTGAARAPARCRGRPCTAWGPPLASGGCRTAAAAPSPCALATA